MRPGHSAPWSRQLQDAVLAAALSTDEAQAARAWPQVSLAACVALGPGPVERLAGLAPPLCVPPEALVPT